MFCASLSSYWKSLPIQCKILFCEDVLNFVPKVPEKLNNSLKEELPNQTVLYPQSINDNTIQRNPTNAFRHDVPKALLKDYKLKE